MLKILQIEKSKFFVKSFHEIVLRLGHNVLSVSNVEEALEFLEQNDIDLIITALSGNELLYEKLENSDFADIPILVLTSTDDIETREKLFELGILDYIVKKNLNEDRLKRYLSSFEKIHDDITTERELEIAVLDDSDFSLKMISKIFRDSPYKNITYYSHSEDLLQAEKNFQVYLIDLILEDTSGEEILLKLRERSLNTIIIIISTVDNFKTISNVLFSGANDYVVKPFDRNYFLAKINSHIRTYLLRQDLEEKNILLKNMAFKDGLTGLYNHRFIVERLREEYERAKRYESSLSVAMIDIDYFKSINDEYGHPVGDKILIEFSTLITNTLRNSDIIGRYGGEEFLVIFPESNIDQAYTAVEKIRKLIENSKFEYLNKTMTISAGLADNSEQAFRNMISIADKKLYKAKNSGRNKTCK